MALRPSLTGAFPRAALAAAVVVALSGCATRELARAPSRPDEPWRIPEDDEYVGALRDAARTHSDSTVPPGHAERAAAPAPTAASRKDDATAQNGVSPDAGRKYDLPELIDMAERHHPETREAWEQARQAALAVGLAEHTYLPQLSVNVIAGFQHTPLPIPKNLIPAGYFTTNTRELVPMAAVDWLLFDFGKREAEVQAAKANSFVANVAFTGEHEKVIFAVSRAYYALGAARAQVHVAERAAENAQRAQDISEQRHAQGVATVVEVAQARRQSAQAHFDLVRASGGERTAYSALVASMGVDPSTPIAVADSSDRPLPAVPMQDVRTLVEEAVSRRPDVIAALGKVRAAEANVRVAYGAYWPKISVTGQVYQNFGALSTDGSPYYTVNRPGANVLLGLDLPIFDAGARDAHLAIARSEASAARAALDGARDQAVEQVTNAYDQLQTSFAEYEAATTLEQTAGTALDAAIDAYRTGVGLLNDVISSENGAIQAALEKENARANVFTAAAALAFTTGAIARNDAPR
jgi:outer membrane protein TolC